MWILLKHMILERFIKVFCLQTNLCNSKEKLNKRRYFKLEKVKDGKPLIR